MHICMRPTFNTLTLLIACIIVSDTDSALVEILQYQILKTKNFIRLSTYFLPFFSFTCYFSSEYRKIMTLHIFFLFIIYELPWLLEKNSSLFTFRIESFFFFCFLDWLPPKAEELSLPCFLTCCVFVYMPIKYKMLTYCLIYCFCTHFEHYYYFKMLCFFRMWPVIALYKFLGCTVCPTM